MLPEVTFSSYIGTSSLGSMTDRVSGTGEGDVVLVFCKQRSPVATSQRNPFVIALSNGAYGYQ